MAFKCGLCEVSGSEGQHRMRRDVAAGLGFTTVSFHEARSEACTMEWPVCCVKDLDLIWSLEKECPNWHSGKRSMCSPDMWLFSPTLTKQQIICSEVLGLRPKGRAARGSFPRCPWKEHTQNLSLEESGSETLPDRLCRTRGSGDLSGLNGRWQMSFSGNARTVQGTYWWSHPSSVHLFLSRQLLGPGFVSGSAGHWRAKVYRSTVRSFGPEQAALLSKLQSPSHGWWGWNLKTTHSQHSLHKITFASFFDTVVTCNSLSPKIHFSSWRLSSIHSFRENV